MVPSSMFNVDPLVSSHKSQLPKDANKYNVVLISSYNIDHERSSTRAEREVKIMHITGLVSSRGFAACPSRVPPVLALVPRKKNRRLTLRNQALDVTQRTRDSRYKIINVLQKS